MNKQFYILSEKQYQQLKDKNMLPNNSLQSENIPDNESNQVDCQGIKKNADETIGKEVSVPIDFMRQILDKYLTHYLHTPNGKQFEHWERLIDHLRTDLEDYEKFGIVEDIND